MDYISMYIYRQGCELFFYIHIQAVQSQTESIVLIDSHLFVCINLKQWDAPVTESMQGGNGNTMVLFDILSYSFSSVIWGVLIATACTALFVFLTKGWYKDATFSPISYLVSAILFLFLSFQCILIVGSFKILYTTDSYETEISRIVDSAYDGTDEIPKEHADEIIQVIIDRFPLLQYYISGGEFSGFSAMELPHAMADELRSFMRWYIFRRILWCLGFVMVGAVCVIKSQTRSYKPSRQNERSQRQCIQTERRKASRRPRR